MVGASALALGVAGCSKKEDNAKPRQQVAAAPPPRPRVSLESIKMDPKVQFPEERTPTNQEIAQAVAELASALASGNHERLTAMVSPRDQVVLEGLVGHGDWKKQTEAIQAVRVCVINENAGAVQVGLGVQDRLGAFVSAWEATGAAGSWKFSGLAIEPKFAATAKELDGVSLTPPKLPEAKAKELAITRPEDKPKDKSSTEEETPQTNDSGGGGGLRRVPY